MKRQRLLLVEALASHPNTMPDWLRGLLEMRPQFADLDIRFSTHSVRGVCRNPITPLICLEIPDFWERTVSFDTYLKLLREESLSPLIFAQIAQCVKHGERTSPHNGVQFHVLTVGEILTVDEGRRKLTDFWRVNCIEDTAKTSKREAVGQHAKLVEWGLAPTWSLGKRAGINRPFILFFKTHSAMHVMAWSFL